MRAMKTGGALAALGLLSVFAAACSEDKAPPTTAADATTTTFAPDNQLIDREVQIEITGGRELHLKKRLKVQVLRVRTPDPQSSLTSITIPDPVELDGGVLLLPDIALYGTDALQERTTIAPGHGRAPAGAPVVSAPPVKPGETPGHVRFTFLTRSPVTETIFGYHAEPCTVTVQQPNAAAGTAECGAVYANTGERVRFKMTWNP